MTYEFDKVYVNDVAFPYTPALVTAGQNDLDKDSYTNLEGYTVRNRIRHDVKTLDFSIPTMNGYELSELLALRDETWFPCTFFDEVTMTMITKTMYCSSPSYTKYYIHPTDPTKNIYTDISFGFVEE